MKMLTTQMSGLLDRIATNNESAIEETARLLAQATVGEGRVIIYGLDELCIVATVAAATQGGLHGAVSYDENLELSTADRVWIFTRSVNDERALDFANTLDEAFIPFAVVAPEKEMDTPLYEQAMTSISTGLTKGLLPGDLGERIGEPHALAALFVYEAVKLSYEEMLEDY